MEELAVVRRRSEPAPALPGRDAARDATARSSSPARRRCRWSAGRRSGLRAGRRAVQPLGGARARPRAGGDALRLAARRRPAALANLSAGDYAMIRFRDERRLFVDPPTGFAVELHASGLHLQRPGRDLRRRRRRSRARSPTTRRSSTSATCPPPEPGTALEFAGFRALTALNQPDVLQPFAIFAGASYFKAISKGQVFGLSARGLAIGTGEAEGEEFPFFRAHWLETPGEGRMVVHSLLDGPSAAGAYRFTIRPGDPTQIDVEATIFAREDIAHLGLAPLTSMFLFDAKDRARARRLPPRRARFRRARHVERLGRAAVAAAALAAAAADQRLLRFGAARLRADPARARASPTTRT